jgi:pyrimidine operon attenuation protein / uracil phosphoribosyltransferase
MNKIRILGDASIRTRLRRMAYELYEAHYEAEGLVVIGIDERGGYLAREMVAYLKKISELDITFVAARLDRTGQPVGIDLSMGDVSELKDQALVVVDDVLYTGSTLLNVVAILLHAAPASIRTVVLIDRGHRQFPISADILGLQLATTVHQHVSVEINPDDQQLEAFLL